MTIPYEFRAAFAIGYYAVGVVLLLLVLAFFGTEEAWKPIQRRETKDVFLLFGALLIWPQIMVGICFYLLHRRARSKRQWSRTAARRAT